MKSKEIFNLIGGVPTDEIREKCDTFRNTIEMVFSMNDKEQLEAFQAIFLYNFYGILPNFSKKNIQFQTQMNMIFSLLKRQRIGWLNNTKSEIKEDFAPNPNPNPNPNPPPRLPPTKI